MDGGDSVKSGATSGSFDSLEEKLQGLQDILEVAKNVVSSLNLDSVLQNILGHALDIAKMPAGSIALYDDDRRQLTLHAFSGLSATFVEKKSWKVSIGGMTARILEHRGIFTVEDTALVDFFNNPLALKEGIRSVLAVPLRVQEKIVGILYLDDFRPRRICESRLGLLSILASFAAMSIDNACLHARMRALACTDGLTGLYNHRQFKTIFRDELARALRYQKNLALVFLDVDDFKAFNDRFGHPLGDRVLVEVAEILRSSFREGDILCRYGGEEFVVILPEASLEDALAAAERSREAVCGHEVAVGPDGAAVHLTVSVGVASFPRDGKTVSDLLQTVDALMYRAKKEGKNRVYHRRR